MSEHQGVGGRVIVGGKTYHIAAWSIRPAAGRDATGRPLSMPSPLVPPALLAAVNLANREEMDR